MWYSFSASTEASAPVVLSFVLYKQMRVHYVDYSYRVYILVLNKAAQINLIYM